MLRALSFLECLCLVLLARALAGQGTVGIVNGDFEEGEVEGKRPKGWFLPVGGFVAALSSEDVVSGKSCLLLTPSEAKGADAAAFGNLMQTVPAAPFRGKYVRLSASLLLFEAEKGARAAMWMRVDREGGKRGFFDNMFDRPIIETGWKTPVIAGTVDADAEGIAVGFMVFGKAKVRVDAVKLEVLGESAAMNAPARPLSDRGLQNLVALTKLMGYVRFFHPSAGTAGLDWDSFAIAAVEVVEGAESPVELAAALSRVVGKVAPLVRIWAGSANAPPADPPASGGDASSEVTAYEHRGVKLGSQVKGMNIYWTKRRRYGAGHADVAAKKLPAPGTVRMKDLGGGVAALIPISVPAEEAGGEEKAESQAESMPATVAGRPVGWVPTGNDRSTRLAAVSLAWPVFQHFYPYFDVVKTDWDQALPAALAKAAGDPDELAFLDTLRALVAKLKDGHGHVSLASAINPARLPVSFAWAGKDLAVDRATRESGLVPGDVVLEIGGVPIADRVAQESSLVSAATEGWLRSRLLNELTSAPSDFPVAVKVRRRDGSTAVVKIADAGRDRKELEVKRPANGSEVAPGVMYFDLDGATAADWNKALPALEKAKGLVFDLRGYPGDAGQLVIRHLATKNVTSAEWHIPAVTLPDREGFACVRTAGWNLAPKKPHLTQKTAFITGGGAISYAESCMGIIEHYKLGEIVGEPTAGTNGNVNPFTLPGRYSVAWTGMKVLKHGGTQHHGIGIRPTVPCSRTLKGIAEGRDELLERAIEVVTAQ